MIRLEGADALAIVTEWSEFRNPDFERMEGADAPPAIFDGRNVYTLCQNGAAWAFIMKASAARPFMHAYVRPATDEPEDDRAQPGL